MKNIYLFVLLILSASCLNAQVFDFYNSIYYLAPDAGNEPGTMLTSSGSNLSTFDFDTAPADHPLYIQGIFYPVQDCGNNNIWVKVQHIAADPNGQKSGQNISATLHSPFLPAGSTDRIGGWNGFLYEFTIFADQTLQGNRSDILNGLFPTSITVASLETLYNDGGYLYEWLSFEILNEETNGWYLNSINFTGINPYSNPGFSAELNYATTGTPTEAPTGFTTDFPSGSHNIYAVDMNLSNAYHSEFRMTASQVSVFRYGYEFTSGGYQGMSMEFGVAPSIVANIQPPVCHGDLNGSIQLDVTGTEPIVYDWIGGNTDVAQDLAPGDYEVHVQDANGCSAETTVSITDPQELVLQLNSEGEFFFDVFATGGVWPYSYQWSTGETTSYVNITVPGVYTVEVTDANGCTETLQFSALGIFENDMMDVPLVFPNPTADQVNFHFSNEVDEVRMMSADGKLIFYSKPTKRIENLMFDMSAFPSGIYFYTAHYKDESVQKGRISVQH